MITDLRINEKGELEGKVETTQWDEMYTKDDLVAMLTELKLEIDEIPINADNSEPFRLGQASAYDKCENLIQQKINKLKEKKDGENKN